MQTGISVTCQAMLHLLECGPRQMSSNEPTQMLQLFALFPWPWCTQHCPDDHSGDLSQFVSSLTFRMHPRSNSIHSCPCRLLHPIMPFVTEELWQKLPRHPSHESRESIMICSYPAAQSAWSNAEVEADMAYVNVIVARTRSLRSGVRASQICSHHGLLSHWPSQDWPAVAVTVSGPGHAPSID